MTDVTGAIQYVVFHPGVDARTLAEEFDLDLQQAIEIVEIATPYAIYYERETSCPSQSTATNTRQ